MILRIVNTTTGKSKFWGGLDADLLLPEAFLLGEDAVFLGCLAFDVGINAPF